MVAADLMHGDVPPLHSQDTIDHALEIFVETDLMALPVVDASPNGRVIGVARRSDVAGTYLRYVHGLTLPAGSGAGPHAPIS